MGDTARGPDRDTPGLTGRVMSLMLGLLLAANLGIMGWGISRMLSFHATVDDRLSTVERSMAVTEGNRFTAADGKDVYRRLATLSETIAKLQAISERLIRIESRLDALVDKFALRGIPESSR